ncbi:MAG: hypothetical protein Kapaf2KO_23290 [Candidatus Kapaibacteriales bacterium]
MISSRSDDEELKKLLLKLYGKQTFEDNRYFLGATYGLTYFSPVNGVTTRESWNTELKYGFDRFTATTHEEVVRYRQEYIALGNVSTRFGPWRHAGDVTNELWYGKIGLTDGYGYDTDYGMVVLNHKINFGVGGNDYEENPNVYLFQQLDESISFFQEYQASYRLELDNGLSIYTIAGDRQFFVDTPFWNRVGSMAVETGLYLLPDLAEEELLDIFGTWYPWIHRTYNTGISFLVYYFRKKSAADWPYNTGKVSNSYVFKIGFDFVVQ